MRRRVLATALRVHVAWGLFAACCALGFARPVAAEPAGLGLNWVRLSGAESCVTSAQLMNRLEARSGRILFVRSGEATLSIDGYVARVDAPSGWAVTLEVSDAGGAVLGHRDLGVLPGDDCKVVAEAAELIFDLTLDPDGSLGTGIPLAPETQRMLDELLHDEPVEPPASLRAAARPSAHKPPASAPPTRADRQQPLPAVTPRAEQGPRFDAALVSGLGELPGAALGLGLSAGLPTRIGWLIELGVATFPVRRAGAGAARADFGLVRGSLGVCPWQPFDALALCAGAAYGSQSVAPTGLGQARPANRPLFDLTGYAALHVALFEPLFVQARAGVLVPLLRNAYSYRSPQGEQLLYRTAPVAARAELGLGLRL